MANRLTLTLLLAASASCVMAADDPLVGIWDPDDRNLEYYDGPIVMVSHTIMWGACRAPYFVISDVVRESYPGQAWITGGEFRVITVGIADHGSCPHVFYHYLQFAIPVFQAKSSRKVPLSAFVVKYRSHMEFGDGTGLHVFGVYDRRPVSR